MANKLLLLGTIALVSAAVYFGAQMVKTDDGVFEDKALLEAFRKFRVEHGKEYLSAAEMEYRMRVFSSNLAAISRHNEDESRSYDLEVNQFADMTFEEFSAFYLGEQPEIPASMRTNATMQFEDIKRDEKEVNWVKEGIVHKPKNQKKCGSCWAFAAVGVTEAAFAKVKKIAVPTLSEQELIDCSSEYGNHGCGGGYAYQALQYIAEKGLNDDDIYPYKANKEACKTDIAGKGWAKIPKFRVLEGGVEHLVEALRVMPSTVSFHVDMFFQFYKRGVYNPKSCSGSRNHAVLAVGFKLDDPIPNFYVKNSWGERWGMDGYFRISMGTGHGTCSLSGPNRNSQPVFE